MKDLDLHAIALVAFNDNVDKKLKKSYNRTIDVQFGVFNARHHTGWLTINLKPSHGWRDWLINLMAFGKIHRGYRWEFDQYGGDILSTIYASKELWEASRKGVIISGRSKGGAEAIMLGMLMRHYSTHDYPNIIVGAIEPPRAFSKKESEKVDIPVRIICYRNDIVPSLPMWYRHPVQPIQIGKRTHGLSFRDHKLATTKSNLIYEGIAEAE